jgi:3-isopropylmalate dehydrogenase
LSASHSDVRFELCEYAFALGAPVLQGAAGGRFVYEQRKQFDLFFKISPLRSALGLPQLSRLKTDSANPLDVLVVRENSGGIYQGHWEEEESPSGRLARHHFTYSDRQASRFLLASARLAKQRRGKLTVAWKEFGLPSISGVWRDRAEDAARAQGVELQMVNIDLLAYLLVQRPQEFDVIAAPNLFGDVLSDLGAALLGSRGMSFSGNFDESGRAVYQTNHGAASDIADTDRANPAGQIFALAMLLRESLGLYREAAAIEDAVRATWREGYRTEDVAGPGTQIIGTREMGRRIGERALEILESHERVGGVRLGDAAAPCTG